MVPANGGLGGDDDDQNRSTGPEEALGGDVADRAALQRGGGE